MIYCYVSCFFFFNDTATTEIYTLSLHDALPILATRRRWLVTSLCAAGRSPCSRQDRKSTRLNSSHSSSSYAVFCLKKKKKPSATLPLRDPEVPPTDTRRTSTTQ